MTNSLTKKQTIALLMGNLIEHYDKVLYGLVAPFVAHLFFPSYHPVVALMLAYMPIGFISRPLGAYVMGSIGDRLGYKKSLLISILGTSLATFCIGCLPTYGQIGILAPIGLYTLRALSCFFAAGETTAAPLLLIENTSNKNKEMMSSYYEMSSILGTFLASIAVTLLTLSFHIQSYWRVLFLISGVLSFTIFIWRNTFPYIEKKDKYLKEPSLFSKNNLLPFLAIVFVTGFSCANYNITLTLLNGYIPLISSHSHTEMFMLHSFLVLLDLAFLPLFALVAKKWGMTKLIYTALILSFVLALPSFIWMGSSSLIAIFTVRTLFVFLGLALASTYQLWTIQTANKDNRFKLIASAKAIGAQVIGGPTVSLSLWMYQKTAWRASPALCIMATAFFALIAMYALKVCREKKIEAILA